MQARLARAARRLLSTDHKVVAARSLWSGLVFLALGGALAMVIRWQRAFPGEPVPVVGPILFPGADGAVTAPAYTALFTSHGLIMIFFAVTPILLGGIGNYVVPLAIGARRMALPRLTALSFWLTCAAQAAAVASLVAPHAPSAGWTGFPPLATGESAPGAGQTAMMVAILLAGCGTVAGALGLLTTVVAGRAPGMTWLRMPLVVWGVFLAAALSALFAPILVAATGLSLLDRLGGTAMFAGGHGDPILYQHLFWIFGHPEVYILILPVWGIVGDLVAFFARKPAFWYRGSVLAMLSIASMSALVYGHHMFRAGLEPMIGAGFEILTLAISAPATVLFVNWLATLWRGALRLTLPMLYALGTIAVLGLGGLSGLFLGSITIDIYLHDTMWVVGHFHLIMATATLLGSFAAIHFWFPKMTGRRLGERLGHIHFWGTLIAAVAAFGGMLVAGYAGQPRRYVDTGAYAFLAGTRDLDRWVSYAGFALGAVQLVFFANLIASARRGRRSGENPWQVPTLEWSTPSPPPPDNFAAVPAVARGPHELGDPDTVARLGRDWIGQWEPPLDESRPIDAGPIEGAARVAPASTSVPLPATPDPTRAADPAGAAAAGSAGPGPDRDADLAGPVGMILFLTSWSILAGALLLAGVALGARPGWPSWPAAVELAGLAGAAFLLFRPGRRRVAAGLLAAAGLVGVASWWPELWPAPSDRAALSLLAAFHLASVAAGAIALVAARPAREPGLLRWYAAALALTWLVFLAAGGAR